MKNYSLKTLEKMREKAYEKYCKETVKPHGNWGDGMRLSKLPSLAAWEKARERLAELDEAIAMSEEDSIDEAMPAEEDYAITELSSIADEIEEAIENESQDDE